MCVCVLSYPAHKAHAPYFHLLSHKRHDFRKTLLDTICVLMFSTDLSETFLIPIRNQIDMITTVCRSSCTAPLLLLRFIKLEFSLKIFKKHSNIQSHENPSSGSTVVPCGRTDGHTDMTKQIVTRNGRHPGCSQKQHITNGHNYTAHVDKPVYSINAIQL